MTLEQAGYTVHQSIDGEDGLRAWQEHRASIDLVLTDLIMPKMGGRAFVEALRKDNRRVPVVFMSGYADADVLNHLPSDADVLLKPCSRDDILEKVRLLLQDLTVNGATQE